MLYTICEKYPDIKEDNIHQNMYLTHVEHYDWMIAYFFYIPCFYIVVICLFKMLEDLQYIHYLLTEKTVDKQHNDIINV